MTGSEILDQIQGIIREVFGDWSVVVTMETTADDVAGWDSLTHIQIITAIEDHYGLKFKLMEVMRFQNVGDMCVCVESHITP